MFVCIIACMQGCDDASISALDYQSTVVIAPAKLRGVAVGLVIIYSLDGRMTAVNLQVCLAGSTNILGAWSMAMCTTA